MQDYIKTILLAGTRAPSGDNCQPWNFHVEGDVVDIYYAPERDPSLYNFQNLASYISHGALLENMSLTAEDLGYSCKITLFPHGQTSKLIAKLIFQPAQVNNQPLCSYIYARSTNRQPYQTIPLTRELKTPIINCPASFFDVGLQLIEKPEDIAKIAKAASVNEQLLFSNKTMHDYFFSIIRWTDQEEQEKHNGLFINTMELKPHQKASFSLFKHWGVLKAFNFLRLSKVVAKENEKNYTNSGAIGAIIAKGRSPIDYIEGGRLFQKVWLTALSLGLSLQPIAGLLFLAKRIETGLGHEFSNNQKQDIKKGYEVIKQVFCAGDKNIIIMFRIGKALAPPSGRTSRLPLENLII